MVATVADAINRLVNCRQFRGETLADYKGRLATKRDIDETYYIPIVPTDESELTPDERDRNNSYRMYLPITLEGDDNVVSSIAVHIL